MQHEWHRHDADCRRKLALQGGLWMQDAVNRAADRATQRIDTQQYARQYRHAQVSGECGIPHFKDAK